MKKVSKEVEEIVQSSEIVLATLVQGCLNYSAYAKLIQKEVERRTKKEVALGTIVVALSRLRPNLKKRPNLAPKVSFDTISLQSNLSEITFQKTAQNQSRLREVLTKQKWSGTDFFTVSYGVAEISLILLTEFKKDVLRVFRGETPTFMSDQLGAVTLRFGPSYIHTPNTTFAFLRPLALQRINIVEVVSTFTELSFIVAEKDLSQAFHALYPFKKG